MQRQEVLQQRLERWAATTIRAISGQPTAEYRSHHLWLNGKPFRLGAPHLHLEFDSHDEGNLRGIADGLALRLLLSDKTFHNEVSPHEPTALLVFELLEQLRVEALAPPHLIGLRKNLHHRFLFWASRAAHSPLTDNDIGMLLYTITVMCWSRLSKQPIPILIEDAIEATRYGISSKIGHHVLGLSRNVDDQRAFSVPARALAQAISEMVHENSSNDKNPEKEQQHKAVLKTLARLNPGDSNWLDSNHSASQAQSGTANFWQNEFDLGNESYAVYCNDYDRTVEITKVIRRAQLEQLRGQLDKRISGLKINTNRVARHLKKLALGVKKANWDFAQEEGSLDCSRLSRLITAPSDHRIFKSEKSVPTSDCVVSILIDNSGSMTHHSGKVAALVDVLIRALALAQINTEVLGYTTGEWNGGKVQRKWEQAGKPNNPGRLNSTLHTIYKDAKTPWRRSRTAVAGMLRPDLYRESFDGEALAWAASRLLKRRESKKIIMLISDGSPMDTATLAANPSHYLDAHLLQVAQSIEAGDLINLCGLGVGLDLSTYFSKTLSISLHEELSTHDLINISDLLLSAT